MTARTIIESDLSGEPDACTTRLRYGENWYEIDLTDYERGQLESLLTPYTGVARKIAVTAKPRSKVVPETTVGEREQIRAWAQEQGYEVAPYGRIPNRVFVAYRAARGRRGRES